MRHITGQAALAIILVAAAGCLSPRGESAPTHTYQLTAEGWPSDVRPAAGDGPVVLVSPPQAEPGFDTPRMAYLKRPYEVEYYGMSQWADAPARLLSPLLVYALSRSGAWGAVIPAPSPVRGDYRLDSNGLALRQEFFQRPSRVRVTMRVHLVEVKESRIAGVRLFEAVEDAPSEDAYGGVTAANRAVAALLGQVATWAESCLRQPAECNR